MHTDLILAIEQALAGDQIHLASCFPMMAALENTTNHEECRDPSKNLAMIERT